MGDRRPRTQLTISFLLRSCVCAQHGTCVDAHQCVSTACVHECSTARVCGCTSVRVRGMCARVRACPRRVSVRVRACPWRVRACLWRVRACPRRVCVSAGRRHAQVPGSEACRVLRPRGRRAHRRDRAPAPRAAGRRDRRGTRTKRLSASPSFFPTLRERPPCSRQSSVPWPPAPPVGEDRVLSAVRSALPAVRFCPQAAGDHVSAGPRPGAGQVPKDSSALSPLPPSLPHRLPLLAVRCVWGRNRQGVTEPGPVQPRKSCGTPLPGARVMGVW